VSTNQSLVCPPGVLLGRAKLQEKSELARTARPLIGKMQQPSPDGSSENGAMPRHSLKEW
jgi:hypothetical protein